ncbi:MAG: hypothetical protein HC828_20355 [Blastochloris sp.]|nr:hypothetical protein [Blastochloris sp.]
MRRIEHPLVPALGVADQWVDRRDVGGGLDADLDMPLARQQGPDDDRRQQREAEDDRQPLEDQLGGWGLVAFEGLGHDGRDDILRRTLHASAPR